jgi:hypothetical protein
MPKKSKARKKTYAKAKNNIATRDPKGKKQVNVSKPLKITEETNTGGYGNVIKEEQVTDIKRGTGKFRKVVSLPLQMVENYQKPNYHIANLRSMKPSLTQRGVMPSQTLYYK